ncbi:MAG: acyl carrier protein [Lachnospiraceae bacterium]|jgi:acyl carrier protein|nr:acyl carrier protein [Lachnospiraceae bacterium]MBR3643503.1 acyl carrier protein [Parasporobacterium sp.]MBR2755979.1 acyl carrier protein [Lachnospiraceae bacterium]MBR3263563.1 acyl carrier protein [Lachnospiraceae bacterium]MBR3360275.1 acyl carrier protein [Lachnospiraceae bacterium]
MKEDLRAILEEIRPDVDFDNETELIDGGVLESMDIVAIVGEIKEAFDVTIGIEQLTPENFNSEEAILELIEQLMEEE